MTEWVTGPLPASPVIQLMTEANRRTNVRLDVLERRKSGRVIGGDRSSSSEGLSCPSWEWLPVDHHLQLNPIRHSIQYSISCIWLLKLNWELNFIYECRPVNRNNLPFAVGLCSWSSNSTPVPVNMCKHCKLRHGWCSSAEWKWKRCRNWVGTDPFSAVPESLPWHWRTTTVSN